MKLIFLDIDGCMIPYYSDHSYSKEEPFPKETADAFNTLMSKIDSSDTSIILSSCWGGLFDHTSQIQTWFGDAGIEYAYRVADKTRHYGDRTESILMYLEKFMHNVCMPIDNILILDDETIVDPLDTFSIKLDPKVGFTSDHVNEAVHILTKVKFDYDNL